MKIKIAFGLYLLFFMVTAAHSQTPTPTCSSYSYSDDFSATTTSNYDFRNNESGTGTQAETGYQITGGVFQTNGGTSANGGFAILNSSTFNYALTDYTVDCDVEMNSYSWQGVFGIAFLAATTGDSYTFQLNGYSGATPTWQIEKQVGGGYSYLATGATTPIYTPGTWIHMRVVVTGNNFQCYVNMGTGLGLQLIYNATDTSSPLTSGGVGFRTYGISSSNLVQFDNFSVSGCGAVATPAPSFTSTPNPTKTATATPTPSEISTVTPTQTPTETLACQIHLWPDPYSRQYAFDKTLRVDCLQIGDQISFFTLTGELVWQESASSNLFQWKGIDQKHLPVSAGIYFYVIQRNSQVMLKGKFLVTSL